MLEGEYNPTTVTRGNGSAGQASTPPLSSILTNSKKRWRGNRSERSGDFSQYAHQLRSQLSRKIARQTFCGRAQVILVRGNQLLAYGGGQKAGVLEQGKDMFAMREMERLVRGNKVDGE